LNFDGFSSRARAGSRGLPRAMVSDERCIERTAWKPGGREHNN
jgi:hypothetical protein